MAERAQAAGEAAATSGTTSGTSVAAPSGEPAATAVGTGSTEESAAPVPAPVKKKAATARKAAAARATPPANPAGAKGSTGPTADSGTGAVRSGDGTRSIRTATDTTKAATSAGAAASKRVRRSADQAPGDPVQAPPIAAESAAKGATMAKPADTKTASRKPAVRATRSAAETEKIRAALAARQAELRREYDQTLSEITELQRERLTDSAGDDQADTGTKTLEREQEISLANSILEKITQVERALERLDEGGYGWCEKCGNPIPVERLAAFPSATLCVTCKQLEERR
jgi:RNA polymerase-binding protein DksA